jgi:hypothetical protein
MLYEIKTNAIAGHEAAIATYATVIGDLAPYLRDRFARVLTRQYLETIKELSQELKEMKAS